MHQHANSGDGGLEREPDPSKTTLFFVALGAYGKDQNKYITLGRQVCTQAVPQLLKARRVDEAGKRQLRQRIHLN